MEQICNEIQLAFNVQTVYDILSSFRYLNVRYTGYIEHSVIKEAPNIKLLKIKIMGLDGNDYFWIVEEHYNQSEKILICEKKNQLEPFKYFRSIFTVSGNENICTISNIKEFKLNKNSGFQLNQVLPSLKMTAKKNIEQVKYELDNIL